MVRPLSWPVLVLVLLLGSGASGQQRPAARLVYEPGPPGPPGTAACPDETAVRGAVSERLGYDPFVLQAERTVSARIRRRGAALVALVELRDAAGQVLGTRELASEKQDCTELASAMALAISIAVDPLVMVRPPSPRPAPAPRPPRQRRRPEVRVSAGALATLGAEPAISGGFTAQVGLRWGLFSIGLEVRADLPASTAVAGLGAVQSSLLLATLVPCLHYRWFLGCALGTLGAMQGSGQDVTQPQQATTLYAAAGARAGAEIHLYRVLWLRPYLDVLATLTRTSLRINTQDVWVTPPVSGDLGLALLGVF